MTTARIRPRTTSSSPGASGIPTVRLLGEVDVVGGPSLTGQQRALTALLAVDGPTTLPELMDALWAGRPISRGRAMNVVAELRAALGRARLPPAADGRYHLAGVPTDVATFERLLAPESAPEAPALAPPTAPVPELHTADLDVERLVDRPRLVARCRALSLVRGLPLRPPPGRSWTWLDDRAPATARLELMVAAVAREALSATRADEGAVRRWICERGLRAAPGDPVLETALAQSYVDDAHPGIAARLARGLGGAGLAIRP